MSYVKSLAPILHATTSPLQQIRALLSWCDDEFKAIQTNLRVPQLRGLQFEELQALPDRYQEGDLYRFGAGVVPGAPGLFLRDANSWRKL